MELGSGPFVAGGVVGAGGEAGADCWLTGVAGGGGVSGVGLGAGAASLLPCSSLASRACKSGLGASLESGEIIFLLAIVTWSLPVVAATGVGSSDWGVGAADATSASGVITSGV